MPNFNPTCELCYDNIRNRIVAENKSVVAIKDMYPVTEAHHLVLPKRHARDYFEMTREERQDAGSMIRDLKTQIEKNDKTVTGFNIGSNCGESAGQTIFHAHIHLIPRRHGDTPKPRGGVRGVIPDRMDYRK
jgi:diadenosine tetraphosphate (Ap4A) HIT family hydrolase